jgi:[acyl-carrier-protein] S-malonyltransferase
MVDGQARDALMTGSGGTAATALIFPGQGSQYVGMGKDLCEAHPRVREIFRRADDVLGFPLSRICFEGPADELTRTKNTQPAIFLHSVALSAVLGDAATGPVAAVAGHSLGEYSALVHAGALGFEEGLRLVRLRGELMQRAGEERPGTMAAVVGQERAEIEEVCREASSAGIVQCANFNSPGQIVISGSVAGVRKAMEIAKAKGARLVKELTVSGAFHSPLMESARAGLENALEKAEIRDASIPVYANVTAGPEQMAGKIRTLLGAQLTSPVLWESTVTNMIGAGVRRFVEIGPGKVLQGLVKRTDPSVEVLGIDTAADLQKVAGGGLP